MPTPDIDPARIAGHPVTAGVLGSLLGLRWAPGLSIVDKCLNVAGGTIVSAFGGPALGEYLELTPSQLAVAGLVLGLFGISLVDAVMRAVRSIDLASIISSWTTRR